MTFNSNSREDWPSRFNPSRVAKHVKTSCALVLIFLTLQLHATTAAAIWTCCDIFDAQACEAEGNRYNYLTCTCRTSSPILLDLSGNGIRLTSATNGVSFDIEGSGTPIQIAWTELGSHAAFLFLDRNGNGRVDSGKELFGNRTEQPPSPNANGFLALAEFDKSENGGNGDGNIDAHDSVFSDLRLWLDLNHDGISQPSEIRTLPQEGVLSLSLAFKESRRRDKFGNEFRYKALVNPANRTGESELSKWAYDVFFVAGEGERK